MRSGPKPRPVKQGNHDASEDSEDAGAGEKELEPGHEYWLRFPFLYRRRILSDERLVMRADRLPVIGRAQLSYRSSTTCRCTGVWQPLQAATEGRGRGRPATGRIASTLRWSLRDRAIRPGQSIRFLDHTPTAILGPGRPGQFRFLNPRAHAQRNGPLARRA